jgi:hypothetical protein
VVSSLFARTPPGSSARQTVTALRASHTPFQQVDSWPILCRVRNWPDCCLEEHFKRSGYRFASRKCDKTKISICLLIPRNLKAL